MRDCGTDWDASTRAAAGEAPTPELSVGGDWLVGGGGGPVNDREVKGGPSPSRGLDIQGEETPSRGLDVQDRPGPSQGLDVMNGPSPSQGLDVRKESNGALYLNIRGVYPKTNRTKINYIRDLASLADSAFIVMTETHLSSDILDAEVAIKGYTSYRADRA